MNILAITSQGENLDSPVDPRFGRARGFILYNEENGETSYIDNTQNLNAMQGAGVQAAKNVTDAGVNTLITGHVGPKAFTALQAAGVVIYTGATGSVSEAIDLYRNGKLVTAEEADVEGHW
jgi:predicted Fe-Mo cluster-binding NifX family protein